MKSYFAPKYSRYNQHGKINGFLFFIFYDVIFFVAPAYGDLLSLQPCSFLFCFMTRKWMDFGRHVSKTKDINPRIWRAYLLILLKKLLTFEDIKAFHHTS